MSLNRSHTTAPDTTASALLALLDATEKEEKKPILTPTQQKYVELTDEAEMRLGFGGMIQHHFPDEETAKTFLEWVKGVAELAEKKIQKASVTQSPFDTYVVRLSLEQYDFLQPCKIPIPSLESSPIHSLEKIQLKIKKVRADTENKPEEIQFADILLNLFPINLSRCDYRRIHKILRSTGPTYLFYFEMLMRFYVKDNRFLKNDEPLKKKVHQLMLQLYKQLPVHFIDSEFKKSGLLLSSLLFLAPANHIHFILEKISANALSASFSSLILSEQFNIVTFPKLDILCKLLKKLHAANFSFTKEALCFQDANDWTLLHRTFYNKSKEAALALLKCCSRDALDAALAKQDNYKETVLHTAARYQDKEVFEQVINTCSVRALTDCCCLLAAGNQGVLIFALSYQPPEMIAKLFKKIYQHGAEFLINNVSKRGLSIIAGYLAFEPSFNDQDIIDKIFTCEVENLLSIATFCKQIWDQGHELPILLVEKLLYIEKSKNLFKAEEIVYLKEYIQSAKSQPPENKSSNNGNSPDKKQEAQTQLVLADGSFFHFDQNIAPEKLVAAAVSHGLQDTLQSRKVRKLLKDPYYSCLLDTLEKNILLFRGTCWVPGANQEGQNLRLKLNRIMQVTQNGNLLLKIIKQEHWGDFVEQIKAYSHRPDLRQKIDKNDPTITHKFVHSSKQIVLFKNHDERKKEYKHTKKQSTTLLSKDLTTAVFGEHDPTRELVGLLFDKEFCVIKGMFSSDKGTFTRGWVGTEQEVTLYKDNIDSVLYTDFNDFRSMVEKNPNRLNEILAKLSRESLLAIVIVNDSQKVRNLAYLRQQNLKNVLNIELPVVCYDRLNRKIRVISPDELISDTVTLDRELLKGSADAVYAVLQNIKKLIQEKKWSSLGIGLPNGAKEILKLIKEAEQSKERSEDPMKIVNCLLEIKKLLLKKQHSKFKRFEKTRQNYVDLYQATRTHKI